MAVKTVSFRKRLVRFGLTLACIMALPLLYVEIQRPWDELEKLVTTEEGVISGVVASFDDSELVRMNRFTSDVITLRVKHLEELPQESYQREAFVQSFQLLLESDTLPGNAQIEQNYEEEGLQFEGYSHATL